eukprot:3562975-Pleurochrysis_carterae.AAC.1
MRGGSRGGRGTTPDAIMEAADGARRGWARNPEAPPPPPEPPPLRRTGITLPAQGGTARDGATRRAGSTDGTTSSESRTGVDGADGDGRKDDLGDDGATEGPGGRPAPGRTTWTTWKERTAPTGVEREDPAKQA